MTQTIEKKSAIDVHRARLAELREAAKAGRETPGGHVRVGEFWYGDDGEEGLIAFRQATKAQLRALGSAEGKDVEQANKRTFAACVLYCPKPTRPSAETDGIAGFIAFMDELEECYPVIWSELISAWDAHNHGARADLRGKV